MVQRLSMALCPACEALNAPGDRHCRACGAPLVMRCPACETINVRARSHCHRCQAPLHADASAEPPTAGGAAQAPGGAGVGLPDALAPPELEAALPAGDEGDTAPMPYRVGSLPDEGAAGLRVDIPEVTLRWPGEHADEAAEHAWILPLRDAELPASRLTAPAPVAIRPTRMPASSTSTPSRRKRHDTLDWPQMDEPLPNEAPGTRASPLATTRAAEQPVPAPGAAIPASRRGKTTSSAAAAAATLAALLPDASREALGPAALAALDPGALAALSARAPDPQRAKAERRTKVRQHQLQAQRRARAGDSEGPTDVLVLEPQVESRATICMVLEAFGFHPRIATRGAEALTMAARRRYAAVMLGIGAQRDEAPELCQQLRALPGLARTPIFAIDDPRHHTDRVRMQLAGAAETLLRPVDRGALARCLQAHGIPLPRDPRLGGPPTI